MVPGDRGAGCLGLVFLACAIALLPAAVAMYTGGEALRPDVGYVVNQPDECHVGLAPTPDSGHATWVASTEHRNQHGRVTSCQSWETGAKVYFNKESLRAPVGSTPEESNYLWGTAVAGLAGLFSGFVGLVYLRGSLTARRARRRERQ